MFAGVSPDGSQTAGVAEAAVDTQAEVLVRHLLAAEVVADTVQAVGS